MHFGKGRLNYRCLKPETDLKHSRGSLNRLQQRFLQSRPRDFNSNPEAVRHKQLDWLAFSFPTRWLSLLFHLQPAMGSKVTGVTGLCFLLSWFSYVSGFR